MRLQRLEIENFRGIREMRIDFHPQLNVFIGENGMGKTTILRALGKTIDIARLDQVTGNERQNLESWAIINLHDIPAGVDHARVRLQFSLGDKNIRTTVSSIPEEMTSDLITHFPETRIPLPHRTFSEDRSTITGAYTPNKTLKNILSGLDPIIASIVKDITSYGYPFAWISDREALENNRLRQFIDSGKKFGQDHFEKDKILQTVKKAIADFTGFDGLFDDRERNGFTVRKSLGIEEETLLFSQLSSGEQHLIAFVLTIAVNLTVNFPEAENPLHGEAVYMIDAIELHVHPSWQRKIIPKLLALFPNCQFVITTHSPQVIGNVKPESVFILKRHNRDIVYEQPDETYGMSIDRIVELVMNDESRPDTVRNDLDKIFELIERNKIQDAKNLIAILKEDMPTDPELLRAEMLVRRVEMKG